MRMTFYTANCRGNAKNSLYPNKRIIDNEADCVEVAAFDHVCGIQGIPQERGQFSLL